MAEDPNSMTPETAGSQYPSAHDGLNGGQTVLDGSPSQAQKLAWLILILIAVLTAAIVAVLSIVTLYLRQIRFSDSSYRFHYGNL